MVNCGYLMLIGVAITHSIVCSSQTETITSANHIKATRKHEASEPCLNFCTPWVYIGNESGECRCGEVPYQVLQCDVGANASLLDNNCITYNEEECLIEVGRCIYTAYDGKKMYTKIPRSLSELNYFMCGKNYSRTGTLCGKCEDGYSLLAYSFDVNCIKCQKGKANWWKYVLAAYLPLTVFYFVILIFKINVTSSRLYPFVIYAQAVSLPIIARVQLMYVRNTPKAETAARLVLMFYGFWNLDFFRTLDLGICLGTNTLQTMALDLAVGVYPLLLMMPTRLLICLYDRNFIFFVAMWKPFQMVLGFFQKNLEIRTSLIDALCTFFLLSNAKLLSSSFDLLVPVAVYQLNSAGNLSHTWRLYNDPTVHYFGQQHLPFAILAIVVLLVFVILPVLLLIVYPFRWFQKFLNLLPARWYVLHTFVDSFQGCYKDGTEPGTCDFRWFASVLFLVRCLLLLIGVSTFNSAYFPVATMVLVVVAMLYIILSPFKISMGKLTQLNVMFILLLALGYTSAIGCSFVEEKNLLLPYLGTLFIVAYLPLLYISAIILHWVYSNRTFGLNIMRRLKAWKHGYEALNH